MSKNRKSRKGKLSRPPKARKPANSVIHPPSLDEKHLKAIESYLGVPGAGPIGQAAPVPSIKAQNTRPKPVAAKPHRQPSRAKTSASKHPQAKTVRHPDEGIPNTPAMAGMGWPSPQNDPYGLCLDLDIDPGLFLSKHFHQFKHSCERIKDHLGQGVEPFGAKQVTDPKLRKWLIRKSVLRQNGKLRNWQVAMLTRAGYNWNRSLATPKIKKEKPLLSPEWMEAFGFWEQQLIKHEGNALESIVNAPLPNRRWLTGQGRQLLHSADADPIRKARFETLAIPADWFPDGFDNRWIRYLHQHLISQGFRSHPQQAPLTPDRQPIQPTTACRFWMHHQRKAESRGKLSVFQIACLDHWAPAFLRHPEANQLADFEKKLTLLVQLKPEPSGIQSSILVEHKLLKWVQRMNQMAAKGSLSAPMRAKLEQQQLSLPIPLLKPPRTQKRQEHPAAWESRRQALQEHFSRCGELRFVQRLEPQRQLANWISYQQSLFRRGQLEDDRIEALLRVHPDILKLPVARNKHVKKTVHPRWFSKLKAIRAYLKKQNLERFPKDTIALHADVLKWLHAQSRDLKAKLLTSEQLELLDSIGFDPEAVSRYQPVQKPPPSFDQFLERFKAFYKTHGHGRVTKSNPDRILLNFVINMRKHHALKRLPKAQEDALRKAGFIFAAFEEPSPAWLALYRKLKACKEARGHLSFTKDEPQFKDIAEFLRQQKRRAKKGLLLTEHLNLLDAIGVDWGGNRPIAKDADPS
jgi:hypothetical protein